MRLSGGDREYELGSYANDWVATYKLEGDDTPYDKKGDWKPGIVDPHRCIFNAAEVERLQEEELAAMASKPGSTPPSSGTFWRQWRLIVTSDGLRGFLEPRREVSDAPSTD